MSSQARPVSELGSAGAWSAQWIAIYAAFFEIVYFGVFACSCGHHGRDAMPGHLLMAILAWNAFIRVPGSLPLARVLMDAITILLTLALLKNLADVLWFGHEPFLGGMRESTRDTLARRFYVAGLAGVLCCLAAESVRQVRRRGLLSRKGYT